MSEWRYQGKQVLQDGRHFADAADEVAAMMIVNAMRALDGHRGGAVAPPERLPLVGEVVQETVQPVSCRSASLCRPMREQDEYVCYVCSVRWDVREPAPKCGRAT